jgi:hypothetical protein
MWTGPWLKQPAMLMVPVVLALWGLLKLFGSEAEPPVLDAEHAGPLPAAIAVEPLPAAQPCSPADSGGAERAAVPPGRPVSCGKSVAVSAMSRSVPARILIKSVWIDAPVAQIGLAGDGTIETPPYATASEAAWYRLGPAPGEAGAAVIIGHVDSRTERAVFFELRRIKPGATIEIRRSDSTRAVFKVDAIEQVNKSDFPAERVYGATATPTLRLVTCGGRFDKAANDYPDNIIVYATMM